MKATTNTSAMTTASSYLSTFQNTANSLLITDIDSNDEEEDGIFLDEYPETRTPFTSTLLERDPFKEAEDLQRKLFAKKLRKANKLKIVKRSLSSFVTKLVPRLHNTIYQRKLEQFRHILRGLVVRRRIKKLIKRRYRSAVLIQKCYR